MRLTVAHEGQAAVVGDVQPLVSVGGPRVGAFQAFDEVPVARRGRRPEAERAVDVKPRVVLARETGDLAERIERAGIHVPCLRADDERTARLGSQPIPQRVRQHAALAVGGDLDHRRVAQA